MYFNPDLEFTAVDESQHVRIEINAAGEYEKQFREWYFQTDGSNLLEVLRLGSHSVQDC